MFFKTKFYSGWVFALASCLFCIVLESNTQRHMIAVHTAVCRHWMTLSFALQCWLFLKELKRQQYNQFTMDSIPGTLLEIQKWFFSLDVCAWIIFPAVEWIAVLAVVFAAKSSLIEELIINKQTDLSEIFCCILLHFPDGSLPEATGEDGCHSFRCLPWCRSSGYQSRFPHCHCKSSLFPLQREFLVKMHLEN